MGHVLQGGFPVYGIMWVRTQLKIGYGDLLAGLLASWSGIERDKELVRAESYFDARDTLACYSVRSGFDLLLRALDLSPGDEVLFSALNVKGMVRIVKDAGLVPVPIDLDFDTMGPRLEKLEAAIGPRSKVFVAAHLFGNRLSLDPLFAITRSRGLIAVEDCAQAFNGRDYPGSVAADVNMFSFGPIKTATALGGALIRVRPDELRERVRKLLTGDPVQPDAKHRKRLLQFLALKVVTSRPALAAIYRFYRWRGMDYENALADRVRDVAPLKSAKNLRLQPSATMLYLMNRRLYGFDSGEIARRKHAGEHLRDKLKGRATMPALGNSHHDYWAFPILARQPQTLINALRESGFDAASLNRSQHIAAPAGREALEPALAAAVMRDLVVLPCYPDMPQKELDRMAEVIADAMRAQPGLPSYNLG